MPPSEAQKRAHQTHEATREKRVAIWVSQAVGKKVDRKCKKLGLASRAAFVEWALAHNPPQAAPDAADSKGE
jgi:hypothetical protein